MLLLTIHVIVRNVIPKLRMALQAYMKCVPPFFELLANPRQEESTQIGQQLQSQGIETLVA